LRFNDFVDLLRKDSNLDSRIPEFKKTKLAECFETEMSRLNPNASSFDKYVDMAAFENAFKSISEADYSQII